MGPRWSARVARMPTMARRVTRVGLRYLGEARKVLGGGLPIVMDDL